MLARNCKARLFATLVTIVAGISSLANAVTASEADATAAPDDGWRRTVDGWEHVSTWKLPAAAANRPAEIIAFSPPLISFNLPQSPLLHPALIALGLLTVGFVGLHLPNSVTMREPTRAEN